MLGPVCSFLLNFRFRAAQKMSCALAAKWPDADSCPPIPPYHFGSASPPPGQFCPSLGCKKLCASWLPKPWDQGGEQPLLRPNCWSHGLRCCICPGFLIWEAKELPSFSQLLLTQNCLHYSCKKPCAFLDRIGPLSVVKFPSPFEDLAGHYSLATSGPPSLLPSFLSCCASYEFALELKQRSNLPNAASSFSLLDNNLKLNFAGPGRLPTWSSFKQIS